MDEARELVADVVRKLQSIREEKGISRYRLSQDTGLSPSGLRHMETGKVSPTLHYLIVIADALEISLADLLSEVLTNHRKKTKGKR
jgi:transcriptional regulator with XRE-family HTH domain